MLLVNDKTGDEYTILYTLYCTSHVHLLSPLPSTSRLSLVHSKLLLPFLSVVFLFSPAFSSSHVPAYIDCAYIFAFSFEIELFQLIEQIMILHAAVDGTIRARAGSHFLENSFCCMKIMKKAMALQAKLTFNLQLQTAARVNMH